MDAYDAGTGQRHPDHPMDLLWWCQPTMDRDRHRQRIFTRSSVSIAASRWTLIIPAAARPTGPRWSSGIIGMARASNIRSPRPTAVTIGSPRIARPAPAWMWPAAQRSTARTSICIIIGEIIVSNGHSSQCPVVAAALAAAARISSLTGIAAWRWMPTALARPTAPRSSNGLMVAVPIKNGL